MPKIAVIGGGISGLTAAYNLRQAKAQPVLFERGPKLGGAIRSLRHNDWLLEAGPDSLLRTKPAALQLAQELGVELLEASSQDPPGIVRGGRVFSLPEGLRLMAPTRLLPFLMSPVMSWSGKLRALCEALIPRRGDEGDESVGHFVSRRFGRELMETLAQPLIGGIYAADLSRLSLQATLPMFADMERQRGSVTAGLLAMLGTTPPSKSSLFLSPRNGMESLTSALAQSIPERDLRRDHSVHALRSSAQGWELETSEGVEKFDGVVFACSSQVSSKLLAGIAPEIGEALGGTIHVSTATVHLQLDVDQITAPTTGSGFVVPHLEGMDITACTFAHKKFPHRAPEGKALLRVHLGNAMNQSVLRCDDFQLVERAVEQVRPLVGLRGQPRESFVARHSRVLPQYEVGHRRRVARAQASLAFYRGLALAGNGLNGVGLSDCITVARTAAESILKSLR